MGRVVRGTGAVALTDVLVGVGGQQGLADGAEDNKPDTYLERVAKFIPAEIVGFYLFVNNLLLQAGSIDTTGKTGAEKAAAIFEAPIGPLSVGELSTFVFWLGLIAAPAYIFLRSQPGDSWKLNSFLSTLVFPFWAYAVQGMYFAVQGIEFDGRLASILLAIVTIVTGFFDPDLVRRCCELIKGGLCSIKDWFGRRWPFAVPASPPPTGG